jgi:photosystem II stability/assembly factor-like uncharacterized protein
MAMAEPPHDLPFAQGLKKSISPAMSKQVPAPAPSRDFPPAASEMVQVQSPNQVEVEAQSSLNAARIEPEAQPLPLQGRNVTELLPSANKTDVVERAKPPAGTPAATGIAKASAVRWTISSAGGLQRSLDGGNTWQDVAVVTMPEVGASSMTVESAAMTQAGKSDKARSREDKKSQTKTVSSPVFRAVAADGLEVWAGGSSSMLYHSRDGGEHWTSELPSADGVALRGDVNSIQFSDPQHGKVSTSSAEVWTTSDGGQSWQKQ